MKRLGRNVTNQEIFEAVTTVPQCDLVNKNNFSIPLITPVLKIGDQGGQIENVESLFQFAEDMVVKTINPKSDVEMLSKRRMLEDMFTSKAMYYFGLCESNLISYVLSIIYNTISSDNALCTEIYNKMVNLNLRNIIIDLFNEYLHLIDTSNNYYYGSMLYSMNLNDSIGNANVSEEMESLSYATTIDNISTGITMTIYSEFVNKIYNVYLLKENFIGEQDMLLRFNTAFCVFHDSLSVCIRALDEDRMCTYYPISTPEVTLRNNNYNWELNSFPKFYIDTINRVAEQNK